MSVTKILNQYDFKEISTLKINNEEGSLSIFLSDSKQKQHEIKLQEVNNYQVIDSSIQDKIYQHQEVRREKEINFIEEFGAKFSFVEIDMYGEEVHESLAKPNFILDSENTSIMAEAEKLVINGRSYTLVPTRCS